MLVQDLFDVKYGINLEFYKMKPDKKGIPFISRQAKNNGMAGRVKIIEGIKPNPANTISVSCGGSVMESFLQEEPYYSGFHILYLVPKKKMTRNELLYYCMVLRSNKYRYNYGRQANKTLSTISIPTPSDIPQWVNKIKIPDTPTKEPHNKTQKSLEDRRWRWFSYDDVFQVSTSKDPLEKDLKPGNTPYISSIDKNNGARIFVKRKGSHQENTITLARNGSVGSAFYQCMSYCASPDDIRILSTPHINIYTGMFLVSLIKMEKYRFNYGRKWGTERIKKSKIKLPVNKRDEPDWKFMEAYIKGLPYSKNLKESKTITQLS